MHKTLLRVVLVAALFSPLSVLLPNIAFADTIQINFESPPYTVGNINGQNGWVKTGTFDANVAASSVANFGAQSLQISDAVTSGSFGDQTFSPSLANEAGESTAVNAGLSGGTRQPHFEAQFDIAAASPHSGDVMSVSPDRGDGARMSYLRFEDLADGIHVHFDDVTDAGPLPTTAIFNDNDIATLNPAVPHTIKFSIDFIDGQANDVVKIYIDGALVHTGGTWENYYRFDPEQTAGDNNQVPTVDSLLFRESGTANAADAGKGFLIDNMTLMSGPIPATPTIVVVTAANPQGFLSEDTNADGAVNFITDATTPAGTGALQLTTDAITTGKADFLHAATGLLTSVTELSYNTKQNSGPSIADPSYQLPVSLDGSGSKPAFTTLVFEPYENGTVAAAGTWQHWDVTKGQFWSTHSFTCSNGNVVAGGGGAPFYTLSQIETMCPSATVLGFGVNIGSNNPSYDVETDLVSFNNTAYDFEPAAVVTPPSTVTVTLDKFIDGKMATAASANNASFPMASSWVTTNFPSGSGTFALGPTGFNSANAYEAVTSPMNSGSSYTANEDTTGTVVGASCATGDPFVLAGYSSGPDTTTATAAGPTATAPNLTDITANQVILVWNKLCVPAPAITSPANGSTVTTAALTEVDWNAVTDSAGGITYTYNVSNAPTTNADGSFATSIFEQAGLTANSIPTPNTSAGVYYLQVQAKDADGNVSAWSPTVMVTVNNTVASTLKVHILKFLDGAEATAATANNYLFPMTATWTTANLNGGAQTSGTYGLGNNFGGNSELYGADTAAMQSPADYATSEITTDTDATSKVVSSLASCVPGDYELQGYKTSSVSFADAESKTGFSDATFTGLNADAYVVVYNVSCASTASLTVTKDSIGGNDTFSFTGPSGIGSFTLTTKAGTASQTFSNLAPGTYTVAETSKSGWTQTESTCNSVVLAAGDNVVCTVTNTKNPKLGAIRGTTFEDWDGDGSPFETRWEVPVPNVTVFLDANNNGVLDNGEVSTVSDKHGIYSFLGLAQGNYHVYEVIPTGDIETFPKIGHYDISLGAGQISKRNDFGNFKLGTISGTVYNDANANNHKDSTETGINNVAVTLSGPHGSTQIAHTDNNGNYSFTNLTVGKYTLSQAVPTGDQQTEHPNNVKVDSATVSTKNNFGDTAKSSGKGKGNGNNH